MKFFFEIIFKSDLDLKLKFLRLLIWFIVSRPDKYTSFTLQCEKTKNDVSVKFTSSKISEHSKNSVYQVILIQFYSNTSRKISNWLETISCNSFSINYLSFLKFCKFNLKLFSNQKSKISASPSAFLRLDSSSSSSDVSCDNSLTVSLLSAFRKYI